MKMTRRRRVSTSGSVPTAGSASEQPVPTLRGSKVLLRALTEKDAGERYVSWMNDPDVVRYTESRFQSYTEEDLREYVRDARADASVLMWAICISAGSNHIGNIKLGPVNWIHRFGDIGLIIGERSVWGNGYATEAISLICDYAFTTLGLNKLTASMYAENIGSKKAFERAHFVHEGLRRSQYLNGTEYTDMVLLGRLKETG